ncbi:MAG: hypothetical protein ACTHOU_06775 [Aureliella sp.]
MNWAELSTAIVNTLAVAVGVLVTAVPIAFLLAVLIARTDALGRRWAWLLLCSQLVVPLYAIVGAWSAGFGTQGWWPLSQSFVVRYPWASMAAVIFIHAVAALPSAVLILMIGLGWTRRSQEELALLEGGKRNLMRRVLLPEMSVWLAAASLWAIVPVLTEMVVTNLYQVPTLPEQIYLDISLGSETGLTIAVSFAGCMLPLLVLLVVLRQHLPSLASLRTQLAQHPPPRLPLGRWRGPLSALMWLVVLGVVVVPLVNLWIKAGWESFLAVDGVLEHRWTWRRLGQTLLETCTLFTAEFQWTAALTLLSSSAAIGTAVLLRSSGRTAWARRAINVICMGLIAMPGPLVATLVSRLFLSRLVPPLNWLYDHTLVAPALAQQTRLLPLAWLLVGGILATIDAQAWELAALDQLSAWKRFRLVVWRPTWRLWLGAWLLIAAVSAGELSTHLLLMPPGVTTLAQRLFELLHFGMRYQDSGLCLALVLLGWLVAIVLWNTRTGRA